MRATSLIDVFRGHPDVVVRSEREESLWELATKAKPRRTLTAVSGEMTQDDERLIRAALDSDTLEEALVAHVNGHLLVIRCGRRATSKERR